ncbi:hypothetical protein WEN_02380 [Mycoplasma wenyonii str. Massachusetts]|uniref:Uncharacterized protein n=1 Tax=Mycoplasma wenyonii (strain Massachusetts) TaxID=1197325 RepID=I6Z6R4_MYCWM|nr:hypothetical protein [Mycoplasma wenyonii]AFN65263.1 hypothetical protein WEN_02380 [Mycoplasma wenyonii str. Massachusetts]
MFKAYLLSAFVGFASLSPLSVFVLPSKDSGNNKGGSAVSSSGLRVNFQDTSSSSVKPNNSVTNPSATSRSTAMTLQTQIAQPPSTSEKTKTPKTPEQEVKPKLPLSSSDLQQWLETISPLFKNGAKDKSVKIIARWNSSYFVILEWEPKLQIFRLLSEDYGVYSNYAGYFTIAKKNAKASEIQETIKKESVNNKNCKNLDGFWYQNWHTWWKFSRWIRSFETGTDGNAIASCSKDPVTFLNVEGIIPTFASEKNWNWRSRRILNNTSVVWDHVNKKFVNLQDGSASDPSIVNNYEDWKRLFDIKETTAR